MLFERNLIAKLARRLSADHGLYLGTLSWRFEGWCGLLYDEDRYLWGTHFSKKRFSARCLEEYAAVFPSVEVDSTYYALPKVAFIEGIAAQTPADFVFSFKVPDEITIKTFPRIKSFGARAGRPNDLFLSPGLFQMGFLRRLEPLRSRVGALVLEFSHFHGEDYPRGREFVEDLDAFFSQLPAGWRYAVEIRNGNWLQPDYFEMLDRHGVAPVYNQWTRMPPVAEQLALRPPEANPFNVARFLLSPGLSRDRAQEIFAPYHQLREIDPGARASMARLMHHAIAAGGVDRPTYLYVGNELEGNALHTIADVLEAALGENLARPGDLPLGGEP